MARSPVSSAVGVGRSGAGLIGSTGLATRAYFAADVVQLSRGLDGFALPEDSDRLEADLRRFGDAALDRRAAAPDLQRLDAQLLRFHAAVVTTGGSLLYRVWHSGCTTEPLSAAPRCAACGRPASGFDCVSTLYPGCRRRVAICPRDGFCLDEPVEWGVTAGVRANRRGDVLRVALSGRARPGGGRAVLAFDHDGHACPTGPVQTLAPAGRDFDVSVEHPRAGAPGVYWVCLIQVKGLDYAYARFPVTVPTDPAP